MRSEWLTMYIALECEECEQMGTSEHRTWIVDFCRLLFSKVKDAGFTQFVCPLFPKLETD